MVLVTLLWYNLFIILKKSLESLSRSCETPSSKTILLFMPMIHIIQMMTIILLLLLLSTVVVAVVTGRKTGTNVRRRYRAWGPV